MNTDAARDRLAALWGEYLACGRLRPVSAADGWVIPRSPRDIEAYQAAIRLRTLLGGGDGTGTCGA